jgi:hypothetical protein
VTAATLTSGQTDELEADTLPSLPHQQHPFLAVLVDLVCSWSSALDAWSDLQRAHSAVVMHCCQRLLLQLHTREARPACLPWCTRCAETAASSSSVSSDLVLHVQLHLHLHLLCSSSLATFQCVLRSGLVHFLLARLRQRLQQEDSGAGVEPAEEDHDHWTLSFQLHDEDQDPQPYATRHALACRTLVMHSAHCLLHLI